MVDLVDTLLRQHEAGRHVTQTILRLAPASRKDGRPAKAAGHLNTIVYSPYRPHAAREDTDLFPKLKDVVSSNEYDSMAEEFEKREHELFGADGFEKIAAPCLEQQMGIHDLDQFTPK
jgi:hemerythrin-like domain-containing protein